MNITKLAIIGLSLSLTACGGAPGGSARTTTNPQLATMTGSATALSQTELDTLSDEQQLQAANKLLGTMMKGMPVNELFNISQGMSSATTASAVTASATLSSSRVSTLLADTRRALTTSLTVGTQAQADIRINNSYSFSRGRAQEEPLAQFYEYPLSKDMFDRYVAYILMNTILFSPAEEIDSANLDDVASVYGKLVQDLRLNRGIRQIVARHQRSIENWRRFRSPEDNTREMIEIYLGLFDRDDDVPLASIACQDLYLTNEDDGYQLLSDGNFNNTPQLIFSDSTRLPVTPAFVTRCNDFYDFVAGHPLLIPRMASVLVDYFMQGRDAATRGQMVQDIAASGARTFQDIVAGIIFSREYLLLTERPKSFEEIFFSTSAQIGWNPRSNIWRGMASGSGGARNTDLEQMGWPTMKLKLGRLAGIPQDAFAFANFHKGFRETLMLDSSRWRNQLVNTEVRALSTNDYIDYLFMSTCLRRAAADEQTDLTALIAAQGHLTNGNQSVANNRHDEIAQIVFDYISRLPEIYYFNQIAAN
ncbi:MAG: hypothetical protein COB94_010730 [Gammaproteobacteria bacterium]|nr:hypothetical protein [Gammaproteobacteria bacterium]